MFKIPETLMLVKTRGIEKKLNKLLSCDSNCIVNVLMWPKLDKSSTTMREVNIILIL